MAQIMRLRGRNTFIKPGDGRPTNFGTKPHHSLTHSLAVGDGNLDSLSGVLHDHGGTDIIYSWQQMLEHPEIWGPEAMRVQARICESVLELHFEMLEVLDARLLPYERMGYQAAAIAREKIATDRDSLGNFLEEFKMRVDGS